MIAVRPIDAAHREDIKLPNQPFSLFGRMVPRCEGPRWEYRIERFETVSEMCFPDEDYDYDALSKTGVILGAYEDERCVGLAILQRGFFRYMYLYDLKVDRDFRGMGVGTLLIERAKQAAAEAGYRGLYTIGQDNNLGACRFYLKCGFRIGGYDTEVYRGTKQEGKADIIFYLDLTREEQDETISNHTL